MFRKVAICAALFAAAIVISLFVKDVTRADVVFTNAFAHAARNGPLAAGDLVAVRPDGGLERVCNVEVRPEDVNLDPRSGLYFNRLDRALSKVVGAARDGGFFDGSRVLAALQTQDIYFGGKASSLRSLEFRYADPNDCPRRVAVALSRGVPICTVSAALIETEEAWRDAEGNWHYVPIAPRTVAVTLRMLVMELPQSTFEDLDVPYTEAAQQIMGERCLGRYRWPLDVKVRNRLHLISREPLVRDDIALRS